jgi:predicted ATPase
VIDQLEKFNKDFFLIFAHVEQSNGLWNELKGGRIGDLWKEEKVAQRTIGFQKVRTHDKSDTICRIKVQQWLGDMYPAEVEGSDPDGVEKIGEGEKCYIKLGSYTFEAVKYALKDHTNRIKLKEKPEYNHSYITQISFEGGTLNGQTIKFSPELNTLIGIRGSGKSSVLETIRYALNLFIPDNDSKYKNGLLQYTLGSGGKIILDAVGPYGLPYQIKRILNEQPNVYTNGKLLPIINISDIVIKKPLFFGQKELAVSGNTSERELIEKIIGYKCDETRNKIVEQNKIIESVINRLLALDNVDDRIIELNKMKNDNELLIERYKQYDLDDKLQRRRNFDADIRKTERGINILELFIEDIKNLLDSHEDDLCSFIGYSSKENPEIFKRINESFMSIINIIESFKTHISESEKVLAELKNNKETLTDKRINMAEEFAEIQRKLVTELEVENIQNISIDDFLSIRSKLDAVLSDIAVLEKNKSQKSVLKDELFNELEKLRELWQEEFKIIETEMNNISQDANGLKFTVLFKEDKEDFLIYLINMFKGSFVHKTTLENITKNYQDCIDIYKFFDNDKSAFGSNPENFIKVFRENLKSFLTYKPPNKFLITYDGVELAQHSIGQRATALILFFLSLKENDVIIIDQPEDDLDNQTLYYDVIKMITKLKPNIQFIFATHNPNIPVLGDAEQIHCCSFKNHKISVNSGSIDDNEQQRKIINIMEGGREAFIKRKERYNIWKP